MKHIAQSLRFVRYFRWSFLAVLGLLAMVLASPARAATITVTNTLDIGPGSLRQAVLDAGSGDTVVFDSAVFSAPMTITLTSGQIEISKSLRIDGVADGLISPTVSGATLSRIFVVDSGAIVTMAGLRLTRGSALLDDANSGGAIYNDGMLTITQSVLLSNTASYGGGILNRGIVSIANTLVAGNTATRGGGGIYNQYLASGEVYVASSVFAGNTALNGPGGGIDMMGRLLRVSQTVFVSNTAIWSNPFLSTDAGYGGAIYTGSGNVHIDSTIFMSNTAPQGGGGGVYCNGSGYTLDVISSTFTANAGGGGAIGARNSCYLHIATSSFQSNSASGNGGAIDAESDWGTLDVENSTFISNSATSGGGAMFIDEPVTYLINVTLAGNVATSIGGAIVNAGIQTTLRNATFAANVSASGASIWNVGVVSVSNSIVASESAQDNCYAAGNGRVIDDGHNLDSGDTCSFTRTTSLNNTHPLLGLMGNYGGPVPTISLLPGSPAIDAGDDAACPLTDARGVHRPFGAHCDIGAFEAAFSTRRLYMPVIGRVSSTVVISAVMFRGTAALNMADQYIELHNRSAAPVNIGGWRITAVSTAKNFEFPIGLVLAPGEACRVFSNALPPINGPCEGLSFQSPAPVWALTHDIAQLFDSTNQLVDVYSYTVTSLLMPVIWR